MENGIRISVYIDGFNFYHALRDVISSEELNNSDEDLRIYKWLDWRKLSKGIIDHLPEHLVDKSLPRNNKIKNIHFYTAEPAYNNSKPNRVSRHRKYKRALKAFSNVKIKEGTFTKQRNTEVYVYKGRKKEENLVHLGDGYSFYRSEEKETDVNIAVDIISDAFNNQYDVAILVTADKDQLPTIRKINEHEALNKQIIISSFDYRGKKRRERNDDLIDECTKNKPIYDMSFIEINFDMIRNSKLPDKITKTFFNDPLKRPIVR